MVMILLFIGIGKALFDMAYTGDINTINTYRFTVTSTAGYYDYKED